MRREAVAIAIALSMVVGEVSPTSAAPAPAQDRAAALGERVLDGLRVAVEEPSHPLVIREAHSDGGYWYWAQRQPANGGADGGH